MTVVPDNQQIEDAPTKMSSRERRMWRRRKSAKALCGAVVETAGLAGLSVAAVIFGGLICLTGLAAKTVIQRFRKNIKPSHRLKIEAMVLGGLMLPVALGHMTLERVQDTRHILHKFAGLRPPSSKKMRAAATDKLSR